MLDFRRYLQWGKKSSATFPRLTLRVRSPSPAPKSSAVTACSLTDYGVSFLNIDFSFVSIFWHFYRQNMDTRMDTTFFAGAPDRVAYRIWIASVGSGSNLTTESVKPSRIDFRGGFFISNRIVARAPTDHRRPACRGTAFFRHAHPRSLRQPNAPGTRDAFYKGMLKVSGIPISKPNSRDSIQRSMNEVTSQR